MSNVALIIGIVAAAAVGIAYFSNMFCQASGGVICWPPGTLLGVPSEPGEKITADPDTGEYAVPESALNIASKINEALGGKGVKPTPTGGPQAIVAPGTVQEALRKLGMTPKLGIPGTGGGGGGGAVKNSAAHIKMMSSACKKKNGPSSCYSEGWARCVPCGSTSGSNFAESQSYYVRTA